MCTVSIVPHRDGLRVVSNRDERRDRIEALEPSITTLGTRAATMPVDPAGGGSWIGVNDVGLVVTVLNRYHGKRAPIDRRRMTRGALVPMMLACDSVSTALARATTIDPTRFEPFRLVLVQRDAIALVSGDGRELMHATSSVTGPVMFTASALGDFLVEEPRRRLFEWLMNDPDSRLRSQALFHRHQWTDKRDISVLMERDDAATVSRTTIDVGDVGARRIEIEYDSLWPRRPARRFELQAC
jgi:hypothetical protein